MKENIKGKIKDTVDLIVIESDIAAVIKKRKILTAPGMDGIQNFYWKTFKPAWRAMRTVWTGWAWIWTSV